MKIPQKTLKLVGVVIVLFFLAKYLELKLSYVAEFSTILGFIFIVYQLNLQLKKDRTELILKLSADFFNNPKFMSVFRILDSDKLQDCNSSIKKIISGEKVQSEEGEKIESVEEIDLNSYMNFFNSLAILVEEKIVSKTDVMKLFRYQLEKTFASIEMMRYMEDYGFERVKNILPQSFFFYGTLATKNDRDLLNEVQPISEFLVNDKKLKLNQYKIEDVGANHEYKGLVKTKNRNIKPIEGSEVQITDDADWTKLFDALDNYEEVDLLYTRSIIQVNNKHFLWVYLKK
jgi:hypothetical protein